MDEIARFRLEQLAARPDEIAAARRLAETRRDGPETFGRARLAAGEIATQAHAARQSARAILRRVGPDAGPPRSE